MQNHFWQRSKSTRLRPLGRTPESSKEDKMDLAQELIEICSLMKEQERNFIELYRSLRAALDVLKIQPRFFDSYQTTYKELASSSLVLQHEQTLIRLDNKIQQLEAERAVNVSERRRADHRSL